MRYGPVRSLLCCVNLGLLVVCEGSVVGPRSCNDGLLGGREVFPRARRPSLVQYLLLLASWQTLVLCVSRELLSPVSSLTPSFNFSRSRTIYLEIRRANWTIYVPYITRVKEKEMEREREKERERERERSSMTLISKSWYRVSSDCTFIH